MAEEEKKHILIVEDDRDLRRVLGLSLEDAGYLVTSTDNGEDAENLLRNDPQPNLVLLDVRLPRRSGEPVQPRQGEAILSHIKTEYPSVPVVMMSGEDTISVAVESIRRGAVEFIAKPWSTEEVLFSAIERAMVRFSPSQSIKELQESLLRRPNIALEKIRGISSPGMRKLINDIGLVSAENGKDLNILVIGEEGTETDLVAETIHQASPRGVLEEKFIKPSLATIPAPLLEKELFGNEDDAYPGAKKYIGYLEQAQGGTLYLPRIDELPLTVQDMLIPFVADRSINRLGGVGSPFNVDVLFIASSSRNLATLIREGRLRPGLLYSIVGSLINVPPLRERNEDMPELVADHLNKFGRDTQISDAAMDLLKEHNWPGNIIELRNVLRQAIRRARGRVISPNHIVLPFKQS